MRPDFILRLNSMDVNQRKGVTAASFLQILIWCPQNDEFLKNPEKIRDDPNWVSK